MRILVAGASGLLGRAMLPQLRGHIVLGTTRRPERAALLSALGAEPALCDVYESGAFDRLARAFGPDVVVNLLTDLAGGAGAGNSRIRREGGRIVTAGARAAGARKLVVESVGFPLGSDDAAAAVDVLERDALASGLDAVVLRFGRFWGPGTWAPDVAPKPPAIHVEEAGRRGAEFVLGGKAGVHLVAGP